MLMHLLFVFISMSKGSVVWKDPPRSDLCEDDRDCVPIDECPDYAAVLSDGVHVTNLTVRKMLQDATCFIDADELSVCCGETVMSATEKHEQHQSCGLSQVFSDRCAGCQDARPGEYPWNTRLLTQDQDDDDPVTYCGGSLVPRSHVITAAHCVTGLTISRVVLGETNIRYSVKPSESYWLYNRES